MIFSSKTILKFQELALVISKDQNERILRTWLTVLRTLLLYRLSVKYELKPHSIAL